MKRFRSRLKSTLAPLYRNRPGAKRLLVMADEGLDLARHTAARVFPQLISPTPQRLFITLTAHCNLRCVGCRYGRDFMPGSQLDWPIVRDLIDDAADLGFETIRLYGGEPLLHPDLPRIVERCLERGVKPYITTNGIALRHKIDELYSAGLREINLGFYGVGDAYNEYTQRKNRFSRFEEGIAYTRERYGEDVSLKLSWLLMRPSCSVEALRAAWHFATTYKAPMFVDLVHYSLPYFTEGPDRELAFRPEDRPALEAVVDELLRLRRAHPDLLLIPELGLRSIPDWLLKGPNMKVPCINYNLIWIGADGSVQLCYVTFKLGNLHEQRLSKLLLTNEHRDAARNAFALRCPNCHCGYPKRVERHLPSRIRYSAAFAGATRSK